MAARLIVMRCRTADRFPGAPRGAETLAPLVGEALDLEPRYIGSSADVRETRFEDDLADSRGDYNTPSTSGSGYLGGMCLAGACGEWDPGLTEPAPAERVVLAGIRDLDPGERALLERSPATVIGASTVETLVAVKNALDGAPVFLHLDFDVLDPEHFPAAVPAAGGLHPDKLYDLLDSVLEDCELLGFEATAFEAPEDEQERIAATETAMHVLEPLLDALGGDA